MSYSSATATAAISIDHLVKRYDKKAVVNDLSLTIPQGSLYGLVGPNGAGKTTTVSMITGMLHPDEGAVSIFGTDVWSNVDEIKRMIGVMPQSDQVFNRLTGLQLLVFSGMLRGMKRATALSRARDLINAFDMQDAASKIVADYSTGMSKKICLATAMIHSPRVLLLDEPFESVDPVSSANLKDILFEYVRTGGTVVVTSHVMALVERMCTHVAVIDHGEVKAAGTMQEVANGEDLDERFLQLVGGRHQAAHLAWLDGAAGDHAESDSAAQSEKE